MKERYKKFNKKKCFKLSEKGFSLIELLSVIVIMGILLLVIVPSVTKYVEQSRKKAFTATLANAVKGVRIEANRNELVFDENDVCYFKLKDVKLDKGNLDAFGDSYVKVKSTENGFEYSIYASNGKYTVGSSGDEIGVSDLPDSTVAVVGATITIPLEGLSCKTKTYTNGEAVYFNPITSKKCDNYVVANSNTENKSGCMKWYAFNDEGESTVNLLLDHNMSNTRWSSTNQTNTGGDAVKAQLASDISGWNSSVKDTARLISANELAKIIGHPAGAPNPGEYLIYFETLGTSCSTCAGLGKGNAKYAWLFDRTGNSCENYGCLNNVVGTGSSAYWTSSPYSTGTVWFVLYIGYMNANSVELTNVGVRPVITVARTIIK